MKKINCETLMWNIKWNSYLYSLRIHSNMIYRIKKRSPSLVVLIVMALYGRGVFCILFYDVGYLFCEICQRRNTWRETAKIQLTSISWLWSVSRFYLDDSLRPRRKKRRNCDRCTQKRTDFLLSENVKDYARDGHRSRGFILISHRFMALHFYLENSRVLYIRRRKRRR